MRVSKLVRDVIFGDELHTKIASGAKKVYDVAKESYGPNAGNALIEYPYGDPEISRDGVNNVRKLKFEDGVENAVAAIMTQASKKNDVNVGDGTTGSVILAYHLYTQGRKLVASGQNAMLVSKAIQNVAAKAVAQIDKQKQPLKKNMLVKVATTSAGDEAIGQLVAETVEAVGADGGVTIEDFGGRIITNEIVEGFYFRKGIIHPYLLSNPAAMESRHINVPILILDRQLTTQADAAEIMEKVLSQNIKELVIIGNVGGDALSFLLQLRMDNKVLLSIVEPEYEARSLFLDDLALLTGATVITDGSNLYDFNVDMLGYAAKAVITTISTTLLGADGEADAVKARIKELDKQLKDATSDIDIQMIRKRLSWLNGKVAIIRVGGSSEVEQREVKLRVVDAVAASQAAMKEGILPGGGTTLARLDVEFKEAFEAPFKQLAANSGANAEKLLYQLQDAPLGYGFNLRDVTDTPVDLIAAGVVDAALVVKEIVTNAASVAAKLLTTSSGITLANRDEKKD
jgi:chaperonin GroEL